VAAHKIRASHPQLGEYTVECEKAQDLLFSENETDAKRLWGQPNSSPYVKDAFHQFVVAGQREAVNPSKTGTKAAAHYTLDVPAGGSKVVRLRLSAKGGSADKFAGRFGPGQTSGTFQR